MSERLAEILRAYGFGFVQDAFKLVQLLEREGFSRRQFQQYIMTKQEEKRKELDFERNLFDKFVSNCPKCPDCEMTMVYREADSELPEEGGHWTCPDCRYGFFEPRTYKQIFHDLTKED